ncbi:pentapeptide repeat-containing protein [Myxosarcina sp. GI1]|uniref:pentapeptide repeat-containing protein n=1 Tax=Myxosarcina sp. GI1 TaxID=1541065 RepID=UPI00056A598F|nr:pentapeptide repeat-containing protein [Myxosarcina sp. GI1]
MIDSSQFIATESLGSKGETAERLVWEGIKASFGERNCLAYWRYPIFSSTGKFRKEPDILIADYWLGLIVIEVKGINIENVAAINGHRWEYRNFYTDYGNPYQQAENQLYSLLEYCDREPLLNKRVTARAMVALPLITQEEWQQLGFDKLPNNPPILFKNSFSSPTSTLESITKASVIRSGVGLTSTQWQLLLAVLGGTTLYIQPYRSRPTGNDTRTNIIQQARSRLNRLDLQQEKLAKQIPPGMQRIRGVAGSGKTVILCQKAALMHVKYPQWRIALVFFSRSLYESITQQVERWIRYFTNGDRGYDRQSNLKILHAWGSREQPGFYSTICKLTGVRPLGVNYTELQQPNEALAEVCVRLLEATAIPQLYDAILIDEGQDLIVERWKYRDKQPFYWLAYQALRPVNPIHPEQKRLIWAYDELQSLDSLYTPDACELFGEELGHLVTGKHSNDINKTEILTCCYRTPKQIIVTAHAIAMGLLRKQGMLTGSIYPEEWQALGYQINGNLENGTLVTLKRHDKDSPNLVGELWSENIIEFNKFSTRQQELSVLADNIKYNLATDKLRSDREILVIVLGTFYVAAELELEVAKFSIRQGLNIYLPTNSDINILYTEPDKRLPDCFWHSGAVTISTIYRAKGQEADMVYLVGLDNIARQEDNLSLRHQLLVALTRSKGWVNISGIGDYSLYRELEVIIASDDTIEFTFNAPMQKTIAIGDRAELLTGYALGRTNFRHANLFQADLSELNLANINLIDANLSEANLTNTNLSGAKLIAANLSGANLTNTNFTKAKLISANLINANLTNTNFTKADLTNIILNDN